jgi:hypothetical protein
MFSHLVERGLLASSLGGGSEVNELRGDNIFNKVCKHYRYGHFYSTPP